MALLLEQRGEEIKITEKVVRAAAGNTGSGREVVALLFKQRRGEVKITEVSDVIGLVGLLVGPVGKSRKSQPVMSINWLATGWLIKLLINRLTS